MTSSTPPGWYPDAGLPATERWWDGTAWTAHTRPRDLAPQQFGPPPAPTPPVFPRGGSGPRTAVLAAVGAVLVAAVVAGAVVVGRGGGDDRPRTATSGPARTPTSDASDGSDGKGTPTSSAPPAADPSLLVDELDGITLPVPDGWEKPSSTVEDVTTMRTEHSYDCPGDSASFCYHATVTSRTATQTELTSAEAVAKADIKDAANSSYDRDLVGNRNYDGITSHTQLASKSLSVAGRTGYLVRWRVRTSAGPGGYVETVAFPSPLGTESMVVVRLAFDAGAAGPPLGTMDTITRGIRPIGDATSGGVGSSIGR
ncbi:MULTISPECIES: DUF2510 domain-containing protein [unclassified Streptomyces]|uniref:DUF2510 domain-containing protein n=1 Tax=unclassified Streptomyces TaxID=2593676 RepID=UPI0020255716|nr:MULTISPECIES: DUF2510 domain-containing protein [unclassified Streptomyces]MCX4552120.1 DUF2510 domain-containing protein [Streptomyces sp. NBC_01500]WSC23462.1 DUF2510 domain-containing protein [Streptomyces sp. NBC_01766]